MGKVLPFVRPEPKDVVEPEGELPLEDIIKDIKGMFSDEEIANIIKELDDAVGEDEINE